MKTSNSLLKLPGLLIAAGCAVSAVRGQVPVNIMPLGDSITEGYVNPTGVTGGYRQELHALLTAPSPGFAVNYVGTLNYPDAAAEGWADGDHEGHSGYKIAQIRDNIALWLKKVPNPDVILLHIGTNDFWSIAPVNVAQKQDDLRNLIADLATLRPHARIIVSSLIPRTDNANYEANQVAFNNSLPGIVATQASLGRNVTFVDLHGDPGSEVLLPADLSDQVHPNTGGYDKMAAAWLPAITSVVESTGVPGAPEIATVEAREDLEHVKVTFNKPILDADAIPGNFTINGGVSVTGASLDASKRVVTLTTGTQPAGAVRTLTVNGVRDRTVAQNTIASGTTVKFTSRAVVDGSFEADDVAWQKTGVVAVFDPAYPTDASDGQKLVVFNFADQGPGGSISQSITTVPGQQYRLQFDMGVYATTTGAQGIKVTVKDGPGGVSDTVLLDAPAETMNVAGTVGVPATKWRIVSYQFTAATTQSTVIFEDTSTETASIDLLLDDVRLEGEPNLAPVAVNDGGVGSPFLTMFRNLGPSDPIAVLDNDSDPDSDPLTVTGAASPNGTVVINGGQTISFTPATDFTGTATISYVISDGQGGTDSATVWVEVEAPGAFANGSFENGELNGVGVLDDWDVFGKPSNPLLGIPFGYPETLPNYVLASGNGGRCAVFNGGSNDFGGRITQVFETVIGQQYKVEFDLGIAGGAAGKAQTLVASISGNLSPPGQTLTWTIIADELVAKWELDKTFIFTATATSTELSFADASVSGSGTDVDLLLDDVRVTEFSGGNVDPLAVDDGSAVLPFRTIDEDSGLLALIDVLTNDSDPDLNPIRITAASSPDGTVAVSGDEQTLSFTPAPDFNGPTTISYTITDDQGGNANAVAYLEVTPVNDPPVAVDDGSSGTPFVSIYKNSGATGPIAVLANDTDVELDPLTVTAASCPNGTAEISPDETTLSFTPALDFTGLAEISYTISDGQGGSDDGTLWVAVDDVTPFANGSFEAGPPVDFGTLQKWDITGDVVAYSNQGFYVPLPANGTWMAVFNAGGNGFGGTLSQTFATVANQEYTVEFDAGLAAGSGSKSQTLQAMVTGEATPPGVPRSWVLNSTAQAASWSGRSFTFVAAGPSVTLTFTDVTTLAASSQNVDMLLDNVRVTSSVSGNQPPVAVDDGSVGAPFVTVAEDSGLSAPITVLANDSDSDGGTLAVTAASSPNGTIVVNGGLTLGFTPAADFNGATTISYTITDGQGGSANATVFVEVTPVNDAPVAVADAYSTTVNMPLNITLPGVIANDTDVDGDALTAVPDAGPDQGGNLTLNPDGSFIYTPATDFTGVETFTYHVFDSVLGSSVETVTITVEAIGPFVNGSFEDGELTGPGALDSWEVAGSPGNPALGIPFGYPTTPPNYVPPSGNGGRFAVFNGGDNVYGGSISQTFATQAGQQYRVDFDLGIGGGATGRTQTLTAGISGDLTPPEQPVSWNITSTGAVAVWQLDRNFTFTATSSATTLTFTCPGGPSPADTDLLLDDVRLTAINGANVPPVAVDDGSLGSPFLTVDEDSGVSAPITVLANDTDSDGGTLVITAATSPDGTVVVNGGLTLGFSPAADFNGATTISYTISDGQGGAANATVFVAVTPVNDAPVAAADDFATPVNVPLVITPPGVLANDADVDGDSLTAVSDSGPDQGGSLTLNPDGGFTYTPASGFSGVETFTYHATDGLLDSNIETVSISVIAAGPFANGSFEDGSPADFGPIQDWETSGYVVSYSSQGNYVPLAGNGTWMAVFNAGDDTFGGAISQSFETITGQEYTVTFDLGIGGGLSNKTQTLNAAITGNLTPPEQPMSWNITSTGGPVVWQADKSFVFTATSPVTTLSFSCPGGPNPSSTDLLLDNVRVVSSGNNLPPVASNDGSTGSPFVTMNEDSGVSAPIAVLANDTDPNSDTLTITTAASPNGTVTINGGTTLGFAPAPDFNGGATISYTISDGNGGSSTATVFIAVIPVNDAPVAIAQSLSTDEDTPLLITLNGTDVDGDPVTGHTITVEPLHGVLSGSWPELTYTPNPDSTTADSFSFTVTDGSLDSAEAVVSITINPINDAPVAIAQSVSTDEDTPLLITLSGTDVDGDPIIGHTITVEPLHGVLSGSWPELTYTPNPDSTTADTFSFTVTDGSLDSAEAVVSITINPINDAPVAIAQSVSTDEDTPLLITLSGTDVDGDPVTGHTITVEPLHGVLSGTWPELTYTPDPDSTTTDSFSFTVTDGAFDSTEAVVSITINPINDAPVAIAQSVSTDEDTPLLITLAGTDVDADPLTYSLTGGPANGILSGDPPNLTYTPNENSITTDSFTFTVDDGTAAPVEATVSITINPINDAPVAIAQSLSTDEDTPLLITLAGTDVDGDPIIGHTITVEPLHGVLSGSWPELTYTPNPDSTTADSFSFTVTDGTLDSAEALISITVNPVNDAPVAIAQSLSTDEDTPLLITLSGTDVDGDPITGHTITVEPLHGALSGSWPELTYTPNPDSTTADSFSFTVTDGSLDSAEAVVSITINPVNDAPVAIAQSVSADEDTPLLITLAGTDVDGDPVTGHTITVEPLHGVLSGTWPELTYTPNPDSTTEDSFSFTVTDGSLDSAEAVVSITINPINDAPVATGESYTTDEDVVLTVAAPGVLANDSDIDGPGISAVLVNDVTNGSLTLLPSGGFTYTPALDFNGADSFTYKVSDGFLESNTVTVNLTVTPVNDRPVADSQTVSVNEDSSVQITLTGRDAEGSPLYFSVIGQPLHGTLSLSGAVVTYTPQPDYNGVDNFDFITIVVSDGGAISLPAMVTINVIPVNDTPVAVAQSVATDEDTPLPITLTGTDVDGDEFVGYTVTVPPAHGTLSGSGANRIYTPSENYHGPDAFSFTVNDGSVDSNEAVISVNVDSVNDAPVAIAQDLAVNEDTSLEITLSGSDVEGDPIGDHTVTLQPAHGTLSGTGTDRIYTPNPDYQGPDSFRFTVNDGTLDSAEAVISITVNPINDAPVAIAQSVSTDEDTPLLINLAGTDVDNDPLTYAVTGNPSNGTLSGDAPNLTYTPNENSITTDSFTFTVDDGTAAPVEATVSITINPINDAPVAIAQSVSTDEDTPLLITLNGTDVDGDPIIGHTITVEPLHGVLSGSWPELTYTPNPDSTTADTFSFTVTDGSLDSAEAVVSITINPINDAPVAIAQSVSADEDTPLLITLSGTDVDGDPIIGHTITVEPLHGVLSGSWPELTYTPNPDSTTADSFSFTVTDGSLDSAEAVVSITINPINDAPVAIAQSVSTDEDTPLLITLSGTDVDGDPIIGHTITVEPLHGVLSGTWPELTYTPNPDSTTADTFSFTVTDGSLDSAEAVVSITINPINDAPVAIAQFVSTDEDTPLLINLSGTDVDGDPIIGHTITVEPLHGVLSGSWPELTYTPEANYNGPDSFSFTVTDGSLDSADAIISITINPDSGDDFNDWLATYSLTASPGDDSDQDQISNLLEYVIGGDPAGSMDADLLPSAIPVFADPDGNSVSENYLRFTYRRTVAAKNDSAVSMSVEWNSGLSGQWNDSAGTPGVVVASEANGAAPGVDLVNVYIPMSLSSNGKLFARLGVMIAPPVATE